MVEETIKNKMKRMIEESEDNNFIYEVYQSEINLLSTMAKLKNSLEIEKVRGEYQYKSKLAELGLFDDSLENEKDFE